MATEHVEVGRLYFVGLAFPSFLNDSSPVKPIPPNVANWHTSDARRQTANVRSVRRHIGLVISVDLLTKVAVILLGTSRPAHPHRYLPWHGTARLSGQPPATIVPTPSDFFLRHHGYLNYTHAIRVRILRLDEVQDRGLPGQGLFLIFLDQGQPVHVSPCVGYEEIEKIKQYHLAYWMHERYEGKGDGDGNDDGDADFDVTKLISLNVAKLNNLSIPSASSSTQDSKADPEHPISGEKISVVMERVLLHEDIRASQLELMENINVDNELYKFPAPCVECVFAPVTQDTLTMFLDLQLEVDGPDVSFSNE